MNQAAYNSVKELILEHQDDIALLKKVNRLSFGLMIANSPESTTNTTNDEQGMD